MNQPMADDPFVQAARTPRTLWVELTSKCPFDCVFCSRQFRRGAGEHLPFAVYESLVAGLVDARRFVLNYSGESTLYPHLLEAIRLARSTGAYVELVSVLATAPESMLGPLSDSGLSRLTVSVHATSPEIFAQVYRHSSAAVQRSRLERLLEHCRGSSDPPLVDLAFVAMDSNLSELTSVAGLAETLGLRDVLIFPVMRRDPIPRQFDTELTGSGSARTEFRVRVRDAVHAAGRSHPEVRFTIGNERFTRDEPSLGEVPVPYPRELPDGAYIHSCEQNPWETAHVLANGDVVACEVLDRVPLGNLMQQPMDKIWHGDAYRRFRERYRRGEIAECRSCPWKRAYLPSAVTHEVLASRGPSSQLLYGWHEPQGEEHVWSSQQAMALLEPRPGSRSLHVSGLLPPGVSGDPNQLSIRINGLPAGTVTNPWEDVMPFGLDFEVPPEVTAPWVLEFRTTQTYRPSERGSGSDQRDLGFALVLLSSNGFVDQVRTTRRISELQSLVHWVSSVDLWSARVARRWRRRPWNGTLHNGITVLIPERDNATELAACLESVRHAAAEASARVQTLVVVNGSAASEYAAIRRRFPDVEWNFHAEPLGFAGAIRCGLRKARHDWVYLLNSDAVLDPAALRELSPEMRAGIFSIASQILLMDTTRFRDETNWTTLILESGLATVHDLIPRSEAVVPTFYAGGGASVFQTRQLRSLVDAPAYAPFYWEDVEWGWRARKLGLESLFCPASQVHHRRRSTIGRLYTSETIEQITLRNRLLFQLRNFTHAPLEPVIEAIAQSPEAVAGYFLEPQARWNIARGRLWNHLAPVTDEEVLASWNNSISNC